MNSYAVGPPKHRIDSQYSAAEFACGFRIRPTPASTRLRSLNPQPAFQQGVSEIILRTEELVALELVADIVL